MDCSGPAIEAFLQGRPSIPENVVKAVKDGSNQQYLNALATLALQSEHTIQIYHWFEEIFVELCIRWGDFANVTEQLSAFARVIGVAPHLTDMILAWMSENYVVDEILQHWALTSEGQERVPEEVFTQASNGLLGLLRLLLVDFDTFSKLSIFQHLPSLFNSQSKAIRHLAFRAACLITGASDELLCKLLSRYCGSEGVVGAFDDRIIDLDFVLIHEQRRRAIVRESLASNCRATIRGSTSRADNRSLSVADLSPNVILVGGRLFWRQPQPVSEVVPQSPLISTDTTSRNIGRFADSLIAARAILLIGQAGSGKSMTIRHVASQLGKASTMITLHLNGQSDAKLLLGIYTTGDQPGSFKWQPGVLATAAKEGRWVLIENLDRVPRDVLDVLLPLIQRGELRLPDPDGVVKAAIGFKIFATLRCQSSSQGQVGIGSSRITGISNWQQCYCKSMNGVELKQITEKRFPLLLELLPRMLRVWDKVQTVYTQDDSLNHPEVDQSRPAIVTDLIKWCTRVQAGLHEGILVMSSELYSERMLDDMLLDAIDCFAGHLKRDDTARHSIVSSIAQELHINPIRVKYLHEMRQPSYDTSTKMTDSFVKIGRALLPILPKRGAPTKASSLQPFSHTRQTCRLLEQIAVAIRHDEPVLLVGESGIGKTTALQDLARSLGHEILVVNLSQQSEAADLLGGFKPLSILSSIIPLKDDFEELFSRTFSNTKNNDYTKLLADVIVKQQWLKAVKLWKQALHTVNTSLSVQPPQNASAEQRSKRRRLDTSSRADLQALWHDFAARVHALEAHLKKASSPLAFSFVEGSLVKAVRNGSWVLLDEINLATPDTLDCLLDLLEGGGSGMSRSILLTEAGHTERIMAHPKSRIFAAMNPATDIGKKDLPQGIRSRFTEIYVESPDVDKSSLASIVKSYICQSSTSLTQERLCSVVTDLYMDIKTLTSQGKLVDCAGERAQYSVRSLTRALSHAVSISSRTTLKRAVYEGMVMTFATFLDVASEAALQDLLKIALFGSIGQSDAELRQALPPLSDHEYAEVNLIVETMSSKKQSNLETHWLPKGKEPIKQMEDYIVTPFIARNIRNLIRASSTRRFPILIQGPTSAGKTSMVEYLAKRSGNQLVRINNHEHTDLQEYLGTYVSDSNGTIKFQDGVLIQALRRGDWVVLDELNLAPTDVLEALNRLLDENREMMIPETQEIVIPHRNFMLFATQNPAGAYGGRKPLSRAFRNRFLELHFDDIPVAELQTILAKRSRLPPSWCTLIMEVHKRLTLRRQEARLFERNSYATLRDLFRWALRGGETIQALAENGFMILAEKVRKPEEKQFVKDTIQQTMSGKGTVIHLVEDHLYARQSDLRYVSDTQIVWTKAMSRTCTLIEAAVKHNEPVLLVGTTGGGKTTVCQLAAAMQRKTLHIMNAHENMETSDLIGAQRPIRDRGMIEAELVETLTTALGQCGVQAEAGSGPTKLLATYDHIPHNAAKSTAESLHQKIRILRGKHKALFEWHDGPLVNAMRKGQFFLLDEISLAEDSVLERMNSALDPQRSILLAEKGSSDSVVVASHGFQLFATMNPGGDYGKKELSPALRNRFTEIWVPPTVDKDDLVTILRTNLRPEAQHLASAMIDFTMWFAKVYGAFQEANVSVRDILSWARFVSMCELDTMTGIVQGAMAIFIDALGANPSSLVSLSTTDVAQERHKCLQKLKDTMPEALQPFAQQDVKITIKESMMKIGLFELPIHCASSKFRDFTFDSATTRKNALKVVRAMQLTKPVLLEGAPGTGKTSLVNALATSTGSTLTRINLSEQTDLMDLFGSDVPAQGGSAGTFVWQDAPFLAAMKTGTWILLDEMNLASQSVLEGLNACIDHRGEVFIPELGKIFPRHPSFRLFAAQNAHHQGGGRKGLPLSFVNRFTLVFVDTFDEEDLYMICAEAFPAAQTKTITKLIDLVTQLNHRLTKRDSFGVQGGPWEINLRDMLRCLSLITSNKGLLPAGEPHDYLDMTFAQRFRKNSDRASVTSMITSCYGQRSRPRSFHTSIASEFVQVGLGLLPRCSDFIPGLDQFVSLSPARLPLLESLIISVNEQWPMLLVGSTEADKNGLLRTLAALARVKLEYLAINADLDAHDFIGSFEQVDPIRKVQALYSRVRAVVIEQVLHLAMHEMTENGRTLTKLAIQLLQCLKASVSPHKLLQNVAQKLEGMSVMLQNTSKDSVVQKLEDLQQECNQLQLASFEPAAATFEWVDGILVTAMQRGAWLVLENANFCSASVLDRLNSLLEPDGCLIINEHSLADGTARTIKPHPEFRIFLTVDPQFGELSRAMRNRVVELFVPVDAGTISRPAISLEPCKAGYAQLIDLIQEHGEGPHDEQLMAAAIQNLGFQDLPTLEQFSQQAEALMSPMQAKHFKMVAHRYVNLSKYEIQAPDLAPQPKICTDGFCSLQAIHPLANVPISLRTIDSTVDYVNGIIGSGLALDCWYQAAELWDWIAASRNDHHLSLLLHHPHSQISSVPAMMSDALHRMLEQMKIMASCSDSADVRKCLSTLLSLLQVMRIMMQKPEEVCLEPEDSRVYIAMLREVVKRLSIDRQVGDLCSILAGELMHFLPRKPLQSGHSMQRIWQYGRPQTPPTMECLEALLTIEHDADCFDESALTGGLPLRDIVQVRAELISCMYNARSGHARSQDLTAKAQALGSVEPGSSSQARKETGPHFKQLFGIISAFLVFETSVVDELDHHSIHTLARIPSKATALLNTKVSLHASLAVFQQYAQFSRTASSDFVDFSTILARGFATVATFSEAPLKQFSLLQDEIQVLSRCLASNLSSMHRSEQASIRKHARAVLEYVLRAHDDLSQEPHGDKRDGGRDVEEMQAEHHFRTIYDDFLIHAEDMGSNHDESNSSWYHLGLGLVYLAIGCLKLYVPDRTLDPAQRCVMARLVHRDRLNDIKRQIDTLSKLELYLTGQAENIRTRLLIEQMEAIGPEPEVTSVVRPVVSQLSELQGEFSNVLRIVQRIVDGAQKGQLDGVAQSGVLQLIFSLAQRLTEHYRAYEDLTGTAVGFLSCLYLGLQIMVKYPAPQLPDTQRTATRLIQVPFVGIDIATWMEGSCRAEEKINDEPAEQVFLTFKTFVLRAQIESPAKWSTHIKDALNKGFRNTFRQWKGTLELHRKQEEKASSLYQYRGDTDLQTENEDEEMAALFPDDERGGQSDQASQAQHRQRPLSRSVDASMIAELHHDIFLNKIPAEQCMIACLAGVKELLKDQNYVSEYTADMLNLLIFEVQSQRQSVCHPGPTQALYNIYTESNVSETLLLRDLVSNLKTRADKIIEIWPEEATPRDISQSCEDLLGNRHTEALAKHFFRIEKLHEYIAEWQTRASREYTLAESFGELTELVIRWRRLELSTWARLLDLESEKCVKEAQSWWSVAYENIIAIPSSIDKADYDVQDHICNVISTVESLLRASSVGQYDAKLKIVLSLKAHIGALYPDHEVLGNLSKALDGLCAHYRRFTTTIASLTASGREALEKDVKNVIQMASWKDTNVTALRLSAKASHRALFKIVKKYRELLRQPVGIHLESQDTLRVTSPNQPTLSQGPMGVDKSALDQAQSRSKDWDLRPLRFKNIAATADVMFEMCSPNSEASLVAPLQIEGFIATSQSAVKQLRNATPSILTEENKSQVKHLAVRKRKLLADTLKNLKCMGIKSSQKPEVLAAQDSLARCFARFHVQNVPSEDDVTAKSTSYLHSALDSMVQVRMVSSKPHEDLTPADVMRITGTLEGLLSLTLHDQKTIVDFTMRSSSLQAIVNKARRLWASSTSNVQPYSQHSLDCFQASMTIVSWLPSIIRTAVQLLKAQAECGDLNFLTTTGTLLRYATRFETMHSQLDQVNPLADGVMSKPAIQVEQEFNLALQHFESDVKKWRETVPTTELIMTQLLRWTRYDQEQEEIHGTNGKVAVDLASFDQRLYSALDDILGSIQAVRAAKDCYPSSSEDADWLVKSRLASQTVMTKFRVSSTISSFDILLDMLQYLDGGDGGTLVGACASITTVLPILDQYLRLYQHCLLRYQELHAAMTRMLSALSGNFLQLLQHGFCKPSEKSQDSGLGKDNKLEGGTGLGEGEGAEDISKDIDADEDLSELAADRSNADGAKDEKQDNTTAAVDVADNLQGGGSSEEQGEASSNVSDEPDQNDHLDHELNDAGHDEDDNDGGDGDADADNGGIDEAVGRVDEPVTDEKFWDEAGNRDQKQKHGDKSNESKDGEKHAAGRDDRQEHGDTENNDSEASDSGLSDGERQRDTSEEMHTDEAAGRERERMDPHVDHGENLDLPEELDLSNGKNANTEHDESDVEMLSEPGADAVEAEDQQPTNMTDVESNDEQNLGDDADISARNKQEPQDVIDEDDNIPVPDHNDTCLKPYAHQEEDDFDGVPTGTAQGVDGNEVLSGEGQAIADQDEVQDKQEGLEELGEAGDFEYQDQTRPPGQSAAGGSELAASNEQERRSTYPQESIKQQGDLTKQHHRRARPIREQASSRTERQTETQLKNLELNDAEFEHLLDDDAEANAQAVGAATQDQARPIDESMGIGSDEQHEARNSQNHDPHPGQDQHSELSDSGDLDMQDAQPSEPGQNETHPKTLSTMVGEPTNATSTDNTAQNLDPDDVVHREEEDLDAPRSQSPSPSTTPHHDHSPSNIWTHHTQHTLPQATYLSQQLLLILTPTLATKLRGSHRTGKRLNLKAIIPYIASQYRRDKIWLRRSIPSKRTYQIQIALDDSESMAENGSAALAFSTLALVTTALTMLESGEVGVLGFGQDVFVAHDLGMPFTGDAGANVVSRFGFEQKGTDVKALVRKAIDIFKDARVKAHASAGELWQLQFIISDGICEDHDAIRRLLLEAVEERIMFVFVIVDAAAAAPANLSTAGRAQNKQANRSITDLIVADFVPVTVDDPIAGQGQTRTENRVVTRRYMSTFPFRYYLIVEDVRDLPDVLASALKGWFAEVAEV